MGCWNETCGVTQLPIHAGDKIRAFILLDNVYREVEGGGTCYSTGEWIPVGISIAGTYDDYGGIENLVENDFTEHMLEYLKDGWLVSDKDAKHWSIPTKPADLKLSDALHAIERGCAKYNSYMGKEKVLGIMYVLEDVFQSMMSFNPIEAHFHYPGYDYKPLRTAFNEDIKEWYEQCFADYSSSELSKTLFRLSLAGSHDLFYSRCNLMTDEVKSCFVDLIKNKQPFESKDVQHLCECLWQMIHFDRTMMRARKLWHPQAGKGSQDNDLAIYKKLQATVDSIISARDKEYEEENVVEEPDENGYYPYMLEQNAKYKAEKEANNVT